MRTKHPFNLIEISIALGVIAIGIVAVVGVFPLAAAKTRDAMAETYAANAATDLLGYIEYQGRNNWSTYFEGNTVVPTAYPTPGTARGGVLDGTNGTIYKTSEVGAYHILSYTDADGDGQYDKATDGNPDFEAEMRLCRKQINNGWAAYDFSEAVEVRLEISWPVEAPYTNRQKVYFNKRFFRL